MQQEEVAFESDLATVSFLAAGAESLEVWALTETARKAVKERRANNFFIVDLF